MRERQRAEERIADLRRRADHFDERASSAGPGTPEHGQPILVGHHSEPAHRRMLDRAHDAWGKQAADAAEARRLRAEADALESTIRLRVFDDDLDAVERLGLQIERLEREVATLKSGAGDLLPLVRRDAIATVRRQIRTKRRRRDELANAAAGQERR